jgi:hypothetical protein
MRRFLWLLTVITIAALGAGVYLVMVDQKGRLPIEVPVGKACRAQTADGSVSLYPEQMANAATIAAVGIAKGIPDRGIVVALATSMQESELINLDYGDRDSLGLFQQRPSQGWGTAEQIRDPHYSTAAFYRQLLMTPGWEEMRITEAAQAVQRSAYPEAYDRYADDAQILGDALVGASAAAITCEKVGEPTLRGSAATEALVGAILADFGRAAEPSASSVTVVAEHDRAGWQLAHWLVARSIGQNISRVRFGQHEWSLETGEWAIVQSMPVDTPAAAGTAVVTAEVYPA